MSFKLVWRRGIAQIHGTSGERRIRESLKTRDPESAKHKFAQRQARLTRAEVYGIESEITFADAALAYMNSGEGEVRYLKPIIEALGKKRLKDIMPGHLKDLANRLKPGCKASTRNRHVIIPARAVINHAAQSGNCAPMRVTAFKEEKVIRRAADRAWIDRFRRHAVHERLAALALFNFVTGARIREAVELAPENIDFAEKLAWGDTKTGPREFYLTDELVEDLRQIEPVKVKDGSLRMFGYSSPNACIWAWKETCKRAGIPYLCRHEAGRHSAATEAVVRKGVDVATAAALLGWKDAKTLLKRYAHPENLRAKAEQVFGTKSAQQFSKRKKIVTKHDDVDAA